MKNKEIGDFCYGEMAIGDRRYGEKSEISATECGFLNRTQLMEEKMNKTKMYIVCILLTILYVNLIGTNIRKGNLIIKLKENTRGETLDSFVNSFSHFDFVERRMLSNRYNIRLFSYNYEIVDGDHFLSILNQDYRIDFAEYDYYYSLQEYGQNDPDFNNQWALKNIAQEIEGQIGVQGADISAKQAWDLVQSIESYSHREVVIAVIDSTPFLYHEDINFWRNEAEINMDGTDPDGNGFLDDYYGWNACDDIALTNDNFGEHGTHVAGISGAITNNNIGISGLSNNIKIMPIIAFPDDYSEGYGFITAYNYILENRIRYNESNGSEGIYIVAVNMSYGKYESAIPLSRNAEYFMIQEMKDAGIIAIAGAGNGGRNIDEDRFFPASYKIANIISVASTTNQDVKTPDYTKHTATIK